MNDDILTPVPLSTRFDIEILPTLNSDGYTALISAWVDEKDKSHHHSLSNAPLEDVADWVAANVRAHIVHRRADMEAGKALWLEKTAALTHA